MEKKTYEITLSYHQSVIVTVDAENEEDALQQAYNADFDEPNVVQLGWEEDADPIIEEI